jgi:HAD superfamily hydrolase (TIGR01509 family)
MILPRMPEAVVFDMDGLLFDTETLYLEAAILAAVEFGHDAGTEVFHRTIGVPWARNRQMLLEHFGAAFPVDDFVIVWLRHFDAIAATRLALKPGVVELLDLLDRFGVPKAIATSSSHRTVQHHLTATGIAGRFHAIVGAGDYAAGKPAPDPFLTAAERLGVAPARCLALEDSHNGVRSAAAAGMMTVMVPDLLAPTDEIRALCALVAADLHEVRSLVLASDARR